VHAFGDLGRIRALQEPADALPEVRERLVLSVALARDLQLDAFGDQEVADGRRAPPQSFDDRSDTIR
jgi:hypothetical protein